jgi:hypothetical protein
MFSTGAGHGVYGEASVLVPLGKSTAVILAAGRYPTDVITGSIAGRYVSAGFRLGRLGFRPTRPAERPQPGIPPHANGADGPVPAGQTRLEITNGGANEPVRLTLYAPDAGVVEISGDFTDWQPVLLQRSATKRDAWEGAFRIAPGIHRINVRRDGGAWMAPAGTTRSADDFGGEVGVFLLP